MSSDCSTSSTVRYGSGASTLATCGAKIGDWVTTSRLGPSATIADAPDPLVRQFVRGELDGPLEERRA